MRKIRYRIALLTGGTVLLMLLIIMAVFNYSITRRIAQLADTALQNITSLSEEYTDVYFMEEAEEDHGYTLYSPEQIFVTDREQDNIFTQKEQAILQWCQDQPKEATLKAEIGGNVYYIRNMDMQDHVVVISKTEYSFNPEDAEAGQEDFSYIVQVMQDGEEIDQIPDASLSRIEEIVAYVDVTGETDMIRQINLIFLLTALVIGTFGTAAGFVLGRKLEQNQLVQKQFFENTSHELKTPLTAIRGYAEGISRGVITDYPKTGRVIAEQTEKMSRLVEEILCLAKLEGGAVKPVKEAVGIPDFIQDCLMPFEGTVLSRGLQVQLDLSPMTVQADPGQLEHALTNLLTNALKYARTEICISCGGGEICIENDCTAIDDDVLQHLFERFYTGRDGNTGIGLALAKDILTLHGWSIAAERAGNGIRFVIRCR